MMRKLFPSLIIAAQVIALSENAFSNETPLNNPQPIKPFVSDGCSLWPDMNHTSCCQQHDRSYWQGGTAKQRKQADQTLRHCVSQTGHPILAVLMYLGVRIGGHGWLPTSFRWGFGYDWPQGYFDESD